jgi:hypothetical protein
MKGQGPRHQDPSLDFGLECIQQGGREAGMEGEGEGKREGGRKKGGRRLGQEREGQEPGR